MRTILSEKLLEARVLGVETYFNEFVPPGTPVGSHSGDKKKEKRRKKVTSFLCQGEGKSYPLYRSPERSP